MKNNRGLSTIVTTLIIILLVLVAIGIIWTVVKGLLDDSKDDIVNSNECRDLDLSVTKISPANASATTALTIKRSSTGMSDGIGAKAVFHTADGNTGVLYFQDNLSASITLEPFETATGYFDLIDAGLTATDVITKVEIIPFFYDDNGAEVLCQTQSTEEF